MSQFKYFFISKYFLFQSHFGNDAVPELFWNSKLNIAKIHKNSCVYSRSELFVDDPGREGRIEVQLNISLPYLSCYCEPLFLINRLKKLFHHPNYRRFFHWTSNHLFSTLNLDIGIDIQDDNGRHEIGFVRNIEKIQIGTNGCRLKGKFEISKVR